jgi:adenylosuccinate synthase
MKPAKVVIGASFGDEGKGHLVDYFSKAGTFVVRFNGGSQAGHTVVTLENRRHIFSHFGSGTLAGARTFLSKFFIVNPIRYRSEFKLLEDLKSLFVHVDKDCIVTTPYDMLINQVTEESRGDNRHSSCGVGINETIERNLNSAYQLRVSDGYHSDAIAKLEDIRTNWVPIRLKALGVERISDRYEKFFKDDGVFNHFIDDLKFFHLTTNVAEWESIVKSGWDIVFEGAQGLMLDEHHEYFPYVTRSKTGLKNVATLSEETGITDLEVVYASRIYSTRHGKGPFPQEVSKAPYHKIKDETNIDNTWQGVLRFGIFDVEIINLAIKKDLKDAIGFNVDISLAITCLDQVDDKVKFEVNGEKKEESIEKFLSYLPYKLLLSNGPTRSNIRRN